MKNKYYGFLIVIFLLASSFNQVTLESETQYGLMKPIASWNFNDITNNTVPDESGHNLTGKLVNTLIIPEITGSAVYFNGHNSYMRVQDSPMLHMENFTLILWFNATNSTFLGTLVSLGLNSNQILSLYVEQNSHQKFSLGIEEAYNNMSTSTRSVYPPITIPNPLNFLYLSPVSTNRWHQIVLEMSPSLNETCTLYFDGQISGVGGIEPIVNIFGPIFFGSDPNFTELSSFIGAIDDVSLYNQTLSASYISAIYQTEKSGLINSSLQTTSNSNAFGFNNFYSYIMTGVFFIFIFAIIAIALIIVYSHRNDQKNHKNKKRINKNSSFRTYISNFINNLHQKKPQEHLSEETLELMDEIIDENK